MVLWGTDNLKTEGGPIAQALALMGAEPRFDSYGRLAGAQLDPARALGPAAHRRRRSRCRASSATCCRCRPSCWPRPRSSPPAPTSRSSRISSASTRSPTRREHGGDLAQAALRVFGNADGAYGANVNQLVDTAAGTTRTSWPRPTCAARASPTAATASRRGRMPCSPTSSSSVELAYQNLEFGRARRHHRRPLLRHARRHQPRGAPRPRRQPPTVYIGDQTRGDGTVRTLAEQVALETRTRMLNPKWYEALLEHGYEGVRQIEAHVTNTHGLVGDDRPGRALGLPAAHRDLRARSGDARAARRAQSDGIGEGRQPAARGARAQLLVARRGDARALRQRRRGTGRPPRRHRSRELQHERSHPQTARTPPPRRRRGQRAGAARSRT